LGKIRKTHFEVFFQGKKYTENVFWNIYSRTKMKKKGGCRKETQRWEEKNSIYYWDGGILLGFSNRILIHLEIERNGSSTKDGPSLNFSLVAISNQISTWSTLFFIWKMLFIPNNCITKDNELISLINLIASLHDFR
jgi:hypothetical protein